MFSVFEWFVLVSLCNDFVELCCLMNLGRTKGDVSDDHLYGR